MSREIALKEMGIELAKPREIDECPNCHRRGYYWNLSNNRRQCRGKKCLTMWEIEIV